MSCRLPRMRGDRPTHVVPYRCPRRATPHARGSTSASRRARHCASGYPACAGIDLSSHRLTPPMVWLPCMRGDRPVTVTGNNISGEATPHARGSTCHICYGDIFWPGYPACAGIDPLPHDLCADRQWLPRMRGDRPRAP